MGQSPAACCEQTCRYEAKDDLNIRKDIRNRTRTQSVSSTDEHLNTSLLHITSTRYIEHNTSDDGDGENPERSRSRNKKPQKTQISTSADDHKTTSLLNHESHKLYVTTTDNGEESKVMTKQTVISPMNKLSPPLPHLETFASDDAWDGNTSAGDNELNAMEKQKSYLENRVLSLDSAPNSNNVNSKNDKPMFRAESIQDMERQMRYLEKRLSGKPEDEDILLALSDADDERDSDDGIGDEIEDEDEETKKTASEQTDD